MSQSNVLLTRLLSSPKLPSVPAVAVRLLELAQDPDCTTKAIVEVIKADPALAVKILKSANSSFFSFRSEIKTLEQAIPMIGRAAVTSLVLSFSLTNEAVTDERLARHYQRFWLQSIVQASAGELMAKWAGVTQASELFMTCLLLDLGQLALLKVLRAEYAPFLEQAEQTDEPLHSVEARTLGFTHVDVGASLLGQWKLPDVMCQAIRAHHSDDLTIDEPLSKVAIMAAAVGDYFGAKNCGACLLRMKTLAKEFFNVEQSRLTAYLEEVEARAKLAGDLLATNTDDLPSASDLMSEACEQLAQISIRQEQERREALTRQQAIEDEKQALLNQNEQLREQVFRDPLTGVYNRRFFDETLSHHVQRAIRTDAPVAVLFIDADHFKKLNDHYGHKFGDTVLVRIASVLQETVRTSGVVARYGGEEFVILATETNESGLHILAERIRAAIEAQVLEQSGKRVPVTVSVGAALMVPQRGDRDPETRLVESADAAMYESKRRGRNRATVQCMTTEFERSLATFISVFRFSNWLVDRRVIDVALMHDLTQRARPKTVHIGELALHKHWLNLQGLKQTLEMQESTGERFGGVAHRLGLLTSNQLAYLLAEQSEDSNLVAEQLVKLGVVEDVEARSLLESFRADVERCLANEPTVERSATEVAAV